MGSCSFKSKQDSPKVLPSASTVQYTFKAHKKGIMKMRQDLEIKRVIYYIKDNSVPTLNLSNSDLYNRRRIDIPTNK